jgi:hypothetical protein
VQAAAAIALVTGVLSIAASVSAQTSGTSWQQHSESPSSSHLVWGSVVLNNDDSCCEQVSEAPLEVSIDANVIAKLQDRAFRMGPVLWLRLVGDRSLRIIDPYPPKYDNFDYQRWRWHLLEAWWDEQRYYVVDVGRHEDRHAYLISEIDGEVSIVFAPPVLSPSGRYAVAFDSSVISGQRLEFIDLTSRPPKMLEITSRPACPGAKAYLLRPIPVWLDNLHVGFEGKPIFDEDPSAKQIFRFADGQVEWEC